MKKPVAISLFACTLFVLAPTAHSQEIRAKPGDTLTIQARGKSDEATVTSQNALPAIELRFVRKSGGKFVEIEGAIPYGRQFFLEARFEQPEDDAFSYDVELDWIGGGGKRISVTRTFDDNNIFRSNPLYLETPE